LQGDQIMLGRPSRVDHEFLVAEPVRDYFLWSLFNTIYMNACCLGFLGMDEINIFSRSYSTIAKRLNIAATVLTLVFYVIIIIWTIRNRY
uniref:Uncharacterized protein n=1 Tax=Callorhinchus milii TaxID=7868 RepID=A0A4W3HR53_CALMI